MTTFHPGTGTHEEWNAAYYRLEDYLRAHQVTNKLHQSQIILRLLRRAATRHEQNPNRTPAQLALEEAHAVIDGWFQGLLPDEPPARAPVIGRVSLYLTQAAARWPNVFLADHDVIPAEFKSALGQTIVQSGPDLRLTSMVPRPLDATDVATAEDEPWERLGRVSAAVLVGIIVLLAGAAFVYLR
jgi:hypothetical protein